VEFGGHLPSVPPETIAAIQTEMDHQPIKELPSNLEVGQWVEITQGAMRGLKGWIAHIRDGHLGSAQHRVHLLMEFLGRENLVQIPSTQILPETNPRTTL
jgi:transcription antitermination factor NusG